MRVRLIDLEPRLRAVRPQLDAAIARVLDRGRFVLGEEGERFESAFAALTGAEHAIGCASGSDALLLSLLSLGIGPGDQVIVPSLTFVSSATAVTRLGAEVVFADIDGESLTLDPASVAEAAALCTRLRAIVPVHLFGRCAEGDALRAVAERSGATLVYDAAQAVGSRDEKGAPPGASGELTTFSFYPTKNLGALGDAGAVTTSDSAHAARLRALRVHGAGQPDHRPGVGINSRLDELQAAALLVLLPGLEQDVVRRNDGADDYDARFAAAAADELGLRTPRRPGPGARHAFHQYVIRVPAHRRDALAAALAHAGIETARYYRVPLHRQPAFQARRVLDAPLAETERVARELLALPVHAGVGDAERHHVVTTATDCLRRTATG
ncbi:MAG: aminotransferase class I/II-fold pyridoxal phosphate-dependent enzyme [Myxococcota bacterium]|nr:aminotransferase class I/II-fold pyridoxal phosphate-dependent enzyme [Myxococcota bacterium]